MNNSRGSTLAIALSMVFLFAAIGVGTINYGTGQRQASVNQAANAQAFWLAEAGLAQTAAGGCSAPGTRLSGNTGVANPSSGVFVSTAKVTVGKYNNVTRVLQQTCTNTSPFQYAALATGTMTLANGVSVDSYDSRQGSYGGTNVGSNGNVAADNTVITNGAVTIHGSSTSNVNVHPSAIIIPPVFSSLASGGTLNVILGTTPLGTSGASCSGSGTLSGGTCYYKYSNITMALLGSMSITGNVSIYLTGTGNPLTSLTDALLSSIVINANSTLKLYAAGQVVITLGTISNYGGTPSNFIIYSLYNSQSASDYGVNISLASGFMGAIYAPNANIYLGGYAAAYGAIIGKNVDASNLAAIHYDQALSTVTYPGSIASTLTSWKECPPTTGSTGYPTSC